MTTEVFALCGNNCKYPTYTQEQILTILQQLVESGSLSGIEPLDNLVVSAIKETHADQSIKLWLGTEAEFNAISPAASLVMGRVDENGNFYLCTDDSTMQGWHDLIVENAEAAVSEGMAGYLPIGTTASDVGAMPIISAITNDFDMDAMLLKAADYTCYKVGANTLGTPYKYGKTDFAWGWIFNYVSSENYGSQFAFIAGSKTPWMRRKSGGVIGEWTTGYLTLDGGTLSGQTIGLYDLYGRIVVGAGTMQLEARANKSATDKRMLFIRSSQSMSDAKRGLQYIAEDGNYNVVYGAHNVTCGTTDLTAGSSALTTDCYYDVYE